MATKNLLILFALAMGFATYGAEGQEGILASDPIVLSEPHCDLGERPATELIELAATPVVVRDAAFGISGIVNENDQFSLPDGESVDEATRIAVTATLAEHYSCLASDKPLAAASLWTDDWIRAQFITEWSATDAGPDSSTPSPPPQLTPGTQLFIESLRVIDRDVVGALVRFQSPDGRWADYVVLQDSGERWLVCGVLNDVQA